MKSKVFKTSDLPAATRKRMGLAAGPSATRVAGGAKARKVGEELEGFIAMAAMKDAGIVDIEQLPKCGAKFIGKDQIISLPIPCDFFGNMLITGRAIYFDAKHSEHASCFDLGNEELLKPHQAEFLHRKDARGAIAGILVYNRGRFLWLNGDHLGPRRGRMPWTDPAWLQLGETLSLAGLLEAIFAAAHEARPF